MKDNFVTNLAANTWAYEEGSVTQRIKRMQDYSGFDLFLHKILKRNQVPAGRAFEVGICPGNVISVLHNLGFEINGVDNCSIVDSFEKKIRLAGFKVGCIYNEDFDKFVEVHNDKYDLVYSCGFVEHFVNFKEIIRKHMKLVNEGGFLLITTPNFAHGLQYYVHEWFDKKNLGRHYLPSMNPKKWEEALLESECSVLEDGYADYSSIWIEAKQTLFYKILAKIVLMLGKCFPASPYFSPVCYILAKKLKHGVV